MYRASRQVFPRARWLLLIGACAAPGVHASEALLERGGCIGCHRVDDTLVGPALRDVAARYRGQAGAAERLFAKVREGSEGEWGDMPMPAKSREHFADEDLSAVIAWILQLP